PTATRGTPRRTLQSRPSFASRPPTAATPLALVKMARSQAPAVRSAASAGPQSRGSSKRIVGERMTSAPSAASGPWMAFACSRERVTRTVTPRSGASDTAAASEASEDPAGAAVDREARRLRSDRRRLADGPSGFGADEPRALEVAHDPRDGERRAVERREPRDRHLAAAAEGGEEGALGGDAGRRARIVEPADRRLHPSVLVPRLDGEGPLSDRRKADVHGEEDD